MISKSVNDANSSLEVNHDAGNFGCVLNADILKIWLVDDGYRSVEAVIS